MGLDRKRSACRERGWWRAGADAREKGRNAPREGAGRRGAACVSGWLTSQGFVQGSLMESSTRQQVVVGKQWGSMLGREWQ